MRLARLRAMDGLHLGERRAVIDGRAQASPPSPRVMLFPDRLSGKKCCDRGVEGLRLFDIRKVAALLQDEQTRVGHAFSSLDVQAPLRADVLAPSQDQRARCELFQPGIDAMLRR